MAGFEQSLGLSLQQTLSPQMQQSLHVLQAPVLELRNLVEQELQAKERAEYAEQKIAEATSRNSAELLALRIARSDILGVDPFEATSALTDAQNKLEALYSVTARLSRLSLVDFLR